MAKACDSKQAPYSAVWLAMLLNIMIASQPNIMIAFPQSRTHQKQEVLYRPGC
jgi:hypothetical protein